MRFPILLALAVIGMPSASHALYEGLQCVPYARALTGVDIRGDAHTWWDQAAGQYQRGNRPKVGAIMSFRPHGTMRLGHVAAVRKVIDKRTVIVSHANWSTIDGQRGHIEENVRIVDASAANDWSRVRVWYTPNAALGTTEWPLNGFIYPGAQLNEGQMKQRLAALLGGKGKFTPVPKDAGKAIPQMAVYKPQGTPAKAPALAPQPKQQALASAKKFTLPGQSLAAIEQAAAKERKPQQAARNEDAIGSLMASLGN